MNSEPHDGVTELPILVVVLLFLVSVISLFLPEILFNHMRGSGIIDMAAFCHVLLLVPIIFLGTMEFSRTKEVEVQRKTCTFMWGVYCVLALMFSIDFVTFMLATNVPGFFGAAAMMYHLICMGMIGLACLVSIIVSLSKGFRLFLAMVTSVFFFVASWRAIHTVLLIAAAC